MFRIFAKNFNYCCIYLQVAARECIYTRALFILPDIRTSEYCTEYTLRNGKIMDIYDIEPGRHLLGYECLPGFTNRVGPDKGRLICFEINGKIQFEEDLPECIFMQEISE